MHTAVLLLVCIGTQATSIGAQRVTTTIPDGTLVGRLASNVETYFGIPYASAPLGNLRFRPPVAPIPWNGNRNASEPRPICPQISDDDNIDLSPRDEDCLFVNVHTPHQRDRLLPVLVWIHGGGFRTGQGALYDGRRIAAREVVVVTFNYRLDVLGFLSTEDDVLPGNYGMLDMIAALQWVKQNIQYFGGDPGKVTIAGQSAGGVAVSMLLLSPLASGLFHGAIMESGQSIMPGAWAQPTRSVSHSLTAKLIGRELGCPINSSLALRQCFETADLDEMLRVSRELRLLVAGWSAPILLSPRVEQVYGFLPDMPSRLLYCGRFNGVNTMRGFNEHEVAYFTDFADRLQGSTAENVLQTIEGLLKPYTIIDKDLIIKRAESYYLDNNQAANPASLAQTEIAFATDFLFEAPTINEIRMTSRYMNHNDYLYRFSVRSQFSHKPNWVTAVHADEIPSLFVPPEALPQFDDSHSRSMETVITLWTNFIKTGNPNEPQRIDSFTWRPFSVHHQNIAHITESGVNMTQYSKNRVRSAFSRFMLRTDTSVFPQC